MPNRKIKIMTIPSSYGEEVCCVKCHRVNVLKKSQSNVVNIEPITFYKISDWISFHWKKQINELCYSCSALIDPGHINTFFRKRRGKWVQIPNAFVNKGPSPSTVRDRKSWSKEKHGKIKSNGKIISKAKFRKINLES